MQLKRVVLPAPLGPMRPMIIPSSIEKETSELAARPPKNLVTCWISSIAMVVSWPYAGLGAAPGWRRRDRAATRRITPTIPSGTKRITTTTRMP